MQLATRNIITCTHWSRITTIKRHLTLCRRLLLRILYPIIIRVCIRVITDAVTIRISPLGWIVGECVRPVRNAIIITIGIGVITQAITICIGCFVGVFRELVGVIAYAVTIGVRCFVRVFRELVCIITYSIAIRIGCFIRIIWKRIFFIRDTIIIGVRWYRVRLCTIRIDTCCAIKFITLWTSSYRRIRVRNQTKMV
ncbi:hypothetical protein SAMN03097708_00839 [Thiohalomonas denitrificans]|uniref:Uncharacterized protein n=1 Tax=Thiohalomonas denitrificans TaxID=415747 RepID=A0A1G5PV96_9GAMM|nr:hypothetical protein SAMN03097708_00839 [Thiohalomonas denitrificans]